MNILFVPLNYHELWQWVQQRSTIVRCADTSGIVAWNKDTQEPVGALVFDTWTNNSCDMHIVLDSPMVLRHGLIEEGADYVFNTAKRRIVLARICTSNLRSSRLAKHFGFREIARVVDGFADGDDTIIYEFRKENYRRIRRSHNEHT